MSTRIPRVLWLLSAAAVLTVAGYGAVAAGKPPKKKPVLVIKSVKAADDQRKPLHSFVHGAGVELVVRIHNKGARGTEGGLDGVLLSKGSGALSFSQETVFELPKIGPGETGAAHVEANGKFDKIDTVTPKVCVPVDGSADFDNSGHLVDRKSCAEGPDFAAIPKVWEGTMSATQTGVYGYAKLESLASPRFRYEPTVSERTKKFLWSGSGDLIHSVSGSGGPCSISGGLNSKIGPGDAPLVLSPNLLTYYGGMNTADVFPATQTCNGHSAPVMLRSLGINIRATNRDETDTTMKDSYTSGPLTFKWDVSAG